MGFPLLANTPDKNRLANIAEHCRNRKIGPIIVSPFFKSLARDRKIDEFNCRMACFYQALLINNVKPLFVAKSENERCYVANRLNANGGISWAIYLPFDKDHQVRLSSLALATGVDKAHGIRYSTGIVAKVRDYFSSHAGFMLVGTKEKIDIALPGFASYLARTGMAMKEIWVEEYLVYSPSKSR